MRICFIGPLDSSHLQKWIDFFSKRDHEIFVVTFETNLPKNFSMKNVSIYIVESRLNHLLKLFPLTSRWAKIRCFRKIIKEISPDIIHGNRISSYGLYTAFSGKYPKILSIWGKIDIQCNTIIEKKLLKLALNRVDLIHSDSNELTKIIKAYGIESKKIVTFPLGIDLQQFKPVKKEELDYPIIISTRDFYPEYNIKLLIDAIPLIIKKYNQSRFIFLGNGVERQNLQQTTEKLGIKNFIKFVGKIPHQEVSMWLYASNIYVSTSLMDGTSVSLLEAMACGLFPVVTDLPSNREWIINEKNGFLVPTNDSKILAQRIIDAFEDRKLRTKAKEINQRIIQEKALWENNAKNMEDCYNKLISKE